MDRYEVRRDGRTLATMPDEAQAWRWLLNYQPQSVHYATTYGGYAIVPVVTIR
jgi:hypothetical protein